MCVSATHAKPIILSKTSLHAQLMVALSTKGLPTNPMTGIMLDKHACDLTCTIIVCACGNKTGGYAALSVITQQQFMVMVLVLLPKMIPHPCGTGPCPVAVPEVKNHLLCCSVE